MGFGDAITLTTYTDYIDLQHQSGNLNTPPGSQVGAIWLTGSNVNNGQKSHIAFQTHLSSSGDISGNVFHGDGSKLSGITVTTFSGSKLTVTGKAIFSNAASLVTSGSISSSGGGTFLGAVIANTVQVSSSIMAAGALTVTGTISSSAEGGFHTLKSQAGATLTGSLVNHGSVTVENGTLSSSAAAIFGGNVIISKGQVALKTSGSIKTEGTLSSSAGAVFLGTVIANTVQVSSSIMAAGALTVTGAISSSAEGGFHTLKSQAGTTLTGSLVNHGGVTLQGEVSSSGGAVFLGTVIANTVQVSSSIMTAGNLTVTGTVKSAGLHSSSAAIQGHSLAIQAGSTLTGSLVNHGAVTITNGTLSSSSPMVIEGTVTLTNDASLSTSGSVEAAGQISGAAGCVIGAGLTIADGDLKISGSAAEKAFKWLGTPNKFLVSGSTFLSGTLDVGNGEPGVGFDVNFYGESQAGVQTTGSFFWDASADKLLFGSGSMIGVGLGTEVTAYAVHLPNIDGAAGQIKANAYITYSSEDLKTNIKTLRDPIEKIKRLRGVTYNWKDSGNHDMGFIAEEVEKIVPEVVYSSKHNSDKGIDYSRITSLLVAAVKEQQDQIEELKALITDDN